MKLRINVTKEMIMHGECGEPQKCAIALAVREMFPGASVGDKNIGWWGDRENFFCLAMPKKATCFIDMFDGLEDDNRDIDPISFEIDVPDSLIEKIGISEVERILSESKTLERV